MIQAVRKAHGTDVENPGEFSYTSRQGVDGHSGMIIRCPGCNKMSFLQLEYGKDAPHPKWTHDGNDDKPTLKPSVHSVGCCGWHGYLRNGEWVK